MNLKIESASLPPMPEAQRVHLSERLDLDESRHASFDRRAHPRLAYRRGDIEALIVQPGGGKVSSVLSTHNLSTQGACFFHRHFLHIGTQVELNLRRRIAGEIPVSGRVTWCRHLESVWHAVGIRFAQPIHPKLFVESAVWESASGATAQKVDLTSLKGDVLLVDDQEMDRALFKHLLRPTALNIAQVSDPDEAMNLAEHQVFDAAFVDLNLGHGKSSGEQLAGALRSINFAGRLVAVTVETQPARLAAAQRAGFTSILQKPYDTQHLFAAVAAAMQPQSDESIEPIFSELAGASDANQLLELFVPQIRAQSERLRQAILADQFDTVRELCQTFKGSGGGFGYPALSQAAAEAVKALDAGSAVGEALTELRRMQNICSRLVPKRAER